MRGCAKRTRSRASSSRPASTPAAGGGARSTERGAVGGVDEEATARRARERLVKCERHVGLGAAAREYEADRLATQASGGELPRARRRAGGPPGGGGGGYEGAPGGA